MEKLGRWSEAVRLLDEWRNIDGYESEKEDGVSTFASPLVALLFFLCTSAMIRFAGA